MPGRIGNRPTPAKRPARDGVHLPHKGQHMLPGLPFSTPWQPSGRVCPARAWLDEHFVSQGGYPPCQPIPASGCRVLVALSFPVDDSGQLNSIPRDPCPLPLPAQGLITESCNKDV